MKQILASIICFVAASTIAHAQAIKYPRINAAVWYEVDPNWPQRPPEVGWGHVPGVAVDRHDNVWIHTRTNLAVQVYSADGRYLKGWHKPATNSVAHFIRFDADGNVWLADVGLHTVTRRSPDDGRVLLTLGTPGEPGCDAAHFFKPTDMAFAPNGDIYVSDGYGNARVAQFDKRGKFIRTWGSLGTAPGQFSLVHSIVCDSQGRLYVADRNNVRVQVFDRRGRLLEVWSDVMVPWGLWVSPNDEIVVCGSSPMIWSVDPKYPTAPLGCPPKDQMFMRFNSAGRLLQLWTLPKAADGEEKPGMLNWFHGIAVDSKGNVYCSDIQGRRVQKFIRKTDPQSRAGHLTR
jgi:DNA-binding beta-propeller fold protein YncE